MILALSIILIVFLALSIVFIAMVLSMFFMGVYDEIYGETEIKQDD